MRHDFITFGSNTVTKKVMLPIVILDKTKVSCQLNHTVQRMGKVMLEENAEEATGEEMMRMVAEIVSAYVSYNTIAGSELPNLIRTVHQSLTGTRTAPEPNVEAAQKPAVAIRKSVQPDHIVCLEDGRKLKMLKRYLRTRYNMTPDEYRTKWGLPADYPMVAPNYSNQRSKFAKKIGLGHRRSEAG